VDIFTGNESPVVQKFEPSFSWWCGQ